MYLSFFLSGTLGRLASEAKESNTESYVKLDVNTIKLFTSVVMKCNYTNRRSPRLILSLCAHSFCRKIGRLPGEDLV